MFDKSFVQIPVNVLTMQLYAQEYIKNKYSKPGIFQEWNKLMLEGYTVLLRAARNVVDLSETEKFSPGSAEWQKDPSGLL